MEISIKRNYGTIVIIKSDNVYIEEDAEDRIYFKTDGGKSDFTKAPKRDIKTEILDQFAMVLSDLICYRVDDYDSSDLIKELFEKLPETLTTSLLQELNNKYHE